MVRRRADLNSLSAAERECLVNSILNYLTDAVVNDHVMITHRGQHILTGHREYIEQLENYLTLQGYSRFVPLPAWNPANPIPQEFRVVKAQDNGSPRPALVNFEPGIPMPSQFDLPELCRIANLDDLGNGLNSWHGNVHNTVGGTMSILAQASAAPIFWCWHAFIDDIYWNYQTRCNVPNPLSDSDHLDAHLFSFLADNGQFLSQSGDGTIVTASEVADDSCRFVVTSQGAGKLALKGQNGLYLSRINYGGEGGRNPIEARKSQIDPFCIFTFTDLGACQVALKADNGLYLSRINYGGVGNFGGRNVVEAAKSSIDDFSKFDVILVEHVHTGH